MGSCLTAPGHSACVIGAGFGGLALAIRLQAAGIATTVIEARDKPGGHAYFWEREGFTFDSGPTAIVDPPGLEELWKLTGEEMARDVELMKVMPFYRFNWPDGTNFDYSNDAAQLNAEIARVAPGDVGGFAEFLDYAAGAWREAYLRLGTRPMLDLKGVLNAAPSLARYRPWRSLYATASKYVHSDKLRQVLCYQALLTGGNPMAVSGIRALIHKLEQDNGMWWPRGGTNRLVAAMVRHFERLGGTVRLHDPVVRVHMVGTHATGVETASGWRGSFSAVASNADVMHTYRDLLQGTKRGATRSAALARKRYSPSFFIVHFGLKGAWPGIPHHTVLLGPRFKGLMADIFEHGVLPADFSIYLHHPTVTDPSMAPPGMSTFHAAIPVAHMGKLAVDWDQIGPLLEKRVLDEIGRRLIPDIHQRIVTRFHYAPRDFALDLNAYMGSAFSLEPIASQNAYFRCHNRDDVVGNFYLVGAGTHPGAGIPAVVAGAKATAGLMLKDLSQ